MPTSDSPVPNPLAHDVLDILHHTLVGLVVAAWLLLGFAVWTAAMLVNLLMFGLALPALLWRRRRQRARRRLSLDGEYRVLDRTP